MRGIAQVVGRLLLASVAGGLVACAEQTPLPGTTPVAAVPDRPPVSDVPVPAEATLDVEASILLGGGDRWTGRLVLTLEESAGDAFALYQQEMPGYGWRPVMSVQAKSSVLTFVRGERAATVQIDSRTLGGSTVAVTVAPRQAGDAAAY